MLCNSKHNNNNDTNYDDKSDKNDQNMIMIIILTIAILIILSINRAHKQGTYDEGFVNILSTAYEHGRIGQIP